MSSTSINERNPTLRSMTFLISADIDTVDQSRQTRSGSLATPVDASTATLRAETRPKRNSMDTRRSDKLIEDQRSLGQSYQTTSSQTFLDKNGSALTGLALERAIHRSKQLQRQQLEEQPRQSSPHRVKQLLANEDGNDDIIKSSNDVRYRKERPRSALSRDRKKRQPKHAYSDHTVDNFSAQTNLDVDTAVIQNRQSENVIRKSCSLSPENRRRNGRLEGGSCSALDTTKSDQNGVKNGRKVTQRRSHTSQQKQTTEDVNFAERSSYLVPVPPAAGRPRRREQASRRRHSDFSVTAAGLETSSKNVSGNSEIDCETGNDGVGAFSNTKHCNSSPAIGELSANEFRRRTVPDNDREARQRILSRLAKSRHPDEIEAPSAEPSSAAFMTRPRLPPPRKLNPLFGDSPSLETVTFADEFRRPLPAVSAK